MARLSKTFHVGAQDAALAQRGLIELNRRLLLEMGFQPIACYTGEKRPYGPGWPLQHGMPLFIATALNTGIVCHNVRAIDIDIDDVAKAETAVGIVRQVLGSTPLVRFRRSSPRRLLVYRGEGAKRVASLDGYKVEVLGRGQQFISDGVHPDGSIYEWEGDGPTGTLCDALPEATDEQVVQLLDALQAKLGTRKSDARLPVFRPSVAQVGSARLRSYAEGAIHAELTKIRQASNGSGNDQLNSSAFSLGQLVGAGCIDDSEIVEVLLDATADRRSRAEALATIRSGLDAGKLLPRTLPADLSSLPAAPGIFDVSELGAANDNGSRDPIPLIGTAILPSQYPVAALGDVLADAARAIAEKVQCAEAMAAQSALAVASLAVQGLADVYLPYGQTRPLSLFCLTIAASGDRKSSADLEAMAPVRMREGQMREAYEPALKEYSKASMAWRAMKAEIERSKKKNLGAYHIEFDALGDEPVAPIKSVLTLGESTAEGLAKHLPTLPGSIGVFSAEGGQFLAGHGFSDEAKLRTAASFSQLWDGAGLRRLRAGDGLIDLHGRRLAAHLMIQPEAAAGVLGDGVLRDQGLLSRFLIAAPDTLAGHRLWREPLEQTEPALVRYGDRMLALFEMPLVSSNTAGNELVPQQLVLSPDALPIWTAFHDSVEIRMRPDSAFAGMKDIAGKAAEQAGRIAGVLQMVEDVHARFIESGPMERACQLVEWHMQEASRMARDALVPPATRDAVQGCSTLSTERH